MLRMVLVGGCCLWAAGWAAAAEGPLGYNRHVRPILAENCFACHGPDSAARKADLRLDRRQEAVDYGAVAPGDPDSSTLVERIFADDAELVMPPPASHKTLSADQKDILRRWIAEGAEYQAHWSLLAPVRPEPPQVRGEAWVRNPIDRFVLAKLEAMDLAPAPEADRRTLARRLALDLTGLPPSPDEVEAFLADAGEGAYERLADRLMATPQWGEHRARTWLDAARYADTHGLHFDNFREMWTYRDWVIDAFNRNQPFDQFTVEQLAGDLLPGHTLQQQIASGFHRCNVTTNEGGTIPEENLVFYTRDRTETTARVWLGLTANCAVCHDHKFDPLTQREFYELSAFFNNTTHGAMDGNVANTPPTVAVPPPADRQRWDALAGEIEAAGRALAARKEAARPEFDAWLAGQHAGALPAPVPAEGLRVHAGLSEGAGASVRFELDGEPLDVPVASDTAWEPGQVAARALKVSAGVVEVPLAGDFERDQAFSYGAWVKLGSARTGAIFARMDDRHAYRGWDLWVEEGRVGAHIIHAWQDDALKVVTAAPVNDQWNHLLVTYDGSSKAAGVKVYVNGQPQATRALADGLKNTIRTDVPLKLGQRSTGSRLDGAALADLRIYARALAPEEVAQLARNTRVAWLAAKPAETRTDAEQDELFAWWLAAVDAASQDLGARLAALEKEKADIRARSSIAHVMQEKDGPAKAYFLHRGEYDQRRDELQARTPGFLPPMPDDLPRNRLGLARWLMQPDQPLVARVAVNRLWQELFGTGIVRTADDFGVAGEMPSHEELLDWLAAEFRESGWDTKAIVRLMVTSATYRQAAVATPEKRERDPENRFLSRGPRFRMDAEMIRDYALAAGGLLVEKIGGPSVKPYQPGGVWEAVAMPESNTRFYRADAGEGLYRRSLYTFWKRAAPPASMEIFNAPSREVCTVRRERTNTPLQALVTLNDPQFVEAARNLAQMAIREGGDDAAGRIRFIALRLLARPLTDEEQAIVRPSLDKLLAFYRAHPDDARQLLTVGEKKPDAALDPAQLAGWTMLANSLMNLDEVLNK